MLKRRTVLKGAAAAGVLASAPGILKHASAATTLRMGHIFPTSHPYHLGLVRFAEEVKQRTDGAVQVEVYPSAQLGGEIELLEGMNLGTVDGGAVAAGSIPQTHGINRFYLLAMPYIFKDYDAVERFATGDLGNEFRANLPEEAGIRILGYGAAGFHHTLNKRRPIEKPSDLEGLKLRIWESPGAKLALEIMGTNPTPMAYSEVFTALQQGVVDGLTNSMTTFYQTKMYEVTKYLSLTTHTYIWIPMTMSESSLQALGSAEQEAVLAAGEAACSYWRGLYPSDDAKYLGKLKEAGIEANDVDLGVFREHVEPGYAQYADVVDQPDADELINKLKKIGGY